eukprot:6198075-Pleurochrysis_carterae.AAC.3
MQSQRIIRLPASHRGAADVSRLHHALALDKSQPAPIGYALLPLPRDLVKSNGANGHELTSKRHGPSSAR